MLGRVRSVGLGLLFLVVAVHACGGDSENASSAPTPIPLDQLPAKVAVIYCSTLKKCMPLYDVYLGGADCVADTTKRVQDTLVAGINDAIAKGTVVYHGEKAQACLDAMQAQDCSLMVNRASVVCEDALEGKVAEGAACTINTECVGRDYCKSTGTCPGKCAPLEATNGPCYSNDACQDGLTCNKATTPGACQPPAIEGKACQATANDCGPNLICWGRGGPANTPGTCKTSAALFVGSDGSTCGVGASDTLCKTGSTCAIDTVGNPSTYKCAPSSAANAACKPGFPNACPSGQYCDAPNLMKGDATGTCKPLPTELQPCTTDAFTKNECLALLKCDMSVAAQPVCKTRQSIGGTCANAAGADDKDLCYSENCSSGKCVARADCKI